MTSVLEAAKESARDAGATKLLKVSLSVGEMTEAIEDALVFAFEALTENDPFTEGAEALHHHGEAEEPLLRMRCRVRA